MPIYNGEKVSKLSATLLLLNLQTTYGWSDNYVDSLFSTFDYYFLNCKVLLLVKVVDFNICSNE